MSYSVQLTWQAKADILEARRWYRSISPQLGKPFSTNARQALDEIRRAPFAYSAIDDLLRSHTLSVFPYCYQYYVHIADLIIVTGLYHHSRNPTVWRKPDIK